VTAQRRRVRVTDAFFEQLDEQLGAHRGPDGEPSSTDFLVIELPAAVERFATGFDDLPEIIDGFHGGRMLIAPGVLVRAIAIYGPLMTDDSIEIIGVELDL
jgi:hypothetical protein